jgi:hypothetical protein
MRQFNHRRRLVLAALVAAATIGSAAPAQAGADASRADCDARLERIEARFRVIEERRGYEAASAWWQVRWQSYYKRCLQP